MRIDINIKKNQKKLQRYKPDPYEYTFICKKNKLTHSQKKLTHARQTYQSMYTQMQNLEYNNVYIQRLDEEYTTISQTNVYDGLKDYCLPWTVRRGAARMSYNLSYVFNASLHTFTQKKPWF